MISCKNISTAKLWIARWLSVATWVSSVTTRLHFIRANTASLNWWDWTPHQQSQARFHELIFWVYIYIYIYIYIYSDSMCTGNGYPNDAYTHIFKNAHFLSMMRKEVLNQWHIYICCGYFLTRALISSGTSLNCDVRIWSQSTET